ncbi:MAG: guanylate kinase [Peptostreptococcaceae bacterium]|nr:guanylate kinase [Peptostreptococcaceae bacterium]
MRKLFTIMGKASTGKDTLTKMLHEKMELPIALSFTTRPMRNGETQGVEYDFITEKDFWDMHGCDLLAEYTSYDVAGGETWYYGLTREELEKSDYVLVIVNPDGFNQIKEIYGDKVCSILIDAPADVRIKRYLDRDIVTETKAEECCRRFLADQKDFKDMVTDYIVMNIGELETVYEELESKIRMELAKDILVKVDEKFRDDPRSFLCR